MKLAIATWNGRVSPVFDVARQVLLVEVDGGRAVARHEETLPGTEPQAQAARLAELGPQILICGAISQAMAGVLAATHIEIVPFTAGGVDEVLAAWLAGKLAADPGLRMPGCCSGRRQRCHGGPVRGRGRGGWAAPRTAVRVGAASESELNRKEPSMKIAITATSREATANLDPRFGRARYFIVVDTETNESLAHDNAQNLNAAQGAGIQAAESIVRLGAAAVITGNVGPKAFRVLSAAGIKVYLAGAGTVEEAVRKFKAGELPEADAANVEGHWA